MLKSLFWLASTALSLGLVVWMGWQFLLACSLLSLATLLFSTARGTRSSRRPAGAEDEFAPTSSFAGF